MITPRIATNRLLLREIQEPDLNDIFDCLMQDEDVSRYMWWKASNDIAEAQEFVNFELGQIESGKWYRWIIGTFPITWERNIGGMVIPQKR